MNSSVRILDLRDDQQRQDWEVYVGSRRDASGYHHAVWLDILEQSFGHPAFPLACCRDGGISGVLPLMLVASRMFGRFLVSLPFVNYGGLLADDDDTAQALLDEAGNLMRQHRARSVELRHVAPLRPDLPSRESKVGISLDLHPDSKEQWDGLKDKVRNQVRKARKAGLAVVMGREKLLDDFYTVFCINMRSLGTPVYGRIFFEQVLHHLPSARIIAVRHEGQCLAAGLLCAHGDVLEMPWASSLPAFRPLCANPLLYWEAIRHGCEEGFRLFDFGRSSPDSGPWRFKKQWGARETQLRWEYLLAPGEHLPELNVANPKFQLAIQAWQHLPLPLTKLIGPRIVRCIP